MVNVEFTRLRHAYESGRTRPLAWRRAQLDALRRLVTDNRDAFASAAMADLGKPAAETILMELNLVAGEAQFVRNRLGLWAARHPKAMHWMLQPAAGWTIAEPKGVVPSSSRQLRITRCCWLWSQWPTRSTAGNAICLKPSELSPNTSRLIAELVPQYLDPESVCVVGGVAAAAQLGELSVQNRRTAEMSVQPYLLHRRRARRQNRHACGGRAPDTGHVGTRRQITVLRGPYGGYQCGRTTYRMGQVHQCRTDLRGTRLCARHAGCGRGSGRAHRRSHHRILWRRSEGLA